MRPLRALSAAAIVVTVTLSVMLVAQSRKEQGRAGEDARSSFREQLLSYYDLSNAKIDVDGLLAPGVPRDGIPALTDPKRVPVKAAKFPPENGRVIEVDINGQAVAYPLGILNWHEIINDRVGGVPIAVTYCPLCDSVAVFDRRLERSGEDGSTERAVLEFGVSGLLYNSNVVMYDRQTRGLWSQVYLRAVSGPDAGRRLRALPIRVVTFGEFKARHPGGEVVSTETGHDRPYDRNPYEGYFRSDRVFHEFAYDNRLAPKTLGLGVLAGEKAYFVPASVARRGPVEVKTPVGPVVVRATEAGMQVSEVPEGVWAVQTFYHSWSAYFPKTEIIGVEPEGDEGSR